MNQKIQNQVALAVFVVMESAIVLLLAFNIIPSDLRFYFLGIFGILTILYSYLSHATLSELGFRQDNFKRAFFINLVLIIISSIAIVAFRELNLVRYVYKNIPPASWYLLYGFALGPVQEFIFRGFLFSTMKKSGINNALAQIVISGVLFGFIHLIYGDMITLLFATVIGIVWGWIYYLKPNIYAVMFSHCVVGILAIYFRII